MHGAKEGSRSTVACGEAIGTSSRRSLWTDIPTTNCSRWMRVYTVKVKDQVCVEFVKFKAQVENSCGCRVKTVQTNRSGEFQSAPFTKMCEQARIARHLTTPYTPQQNGHGRTEEQISNGDGATSTQNHEHAEKILGRSCLSCTLPPKSSNSDTSGQH